MGSDGFLTPSPCKNPRAWQGDYPSFLWNEIGLCLRSHGSIIQRDLALNCIDEMKKVNHEG